MNIFKALKIGRKPEDPNERLTREFLPEMHAFVDIVWDNHRLSVSVDRIDPDMLTTRVPAGLGVGTSVDFIYSNAYGKYRFSTVCSALDDQQAHFEMPATVKTITTYGSKRSAVRLASMMQVQWRYAPGGKGVGDFLKGAMTDFSRTGALLVIDPEIRVGTQLEVRFALKPSETPVVLLSEVMRNGKIDISQKHSAGIRFLCVDPASERTINEFIHERQTQRRARGVV